MSRSTASHRRAASRDRRSAAAAACGAIRSTYLRSRPTAIADRTEVISPVEEPEVPPPSRLRGTTTYDESGPAAAMGC